MVLKQGDLFWGMSKEFVKEAMETTIKINMGEGEFLFNEGDAAGYFYILLTGRVKLCVGKDCRVVYIARHAGEIIGWSSIIGRDTYSASAECLESANMVKVGREEFLGLLKRDPTNEAILFKRLSEMLGNRLLEVYPTII